MQKVYRVAIVGGGSAGLMSAVELLGGAHSLRGEDVVILERNDRVGKKLVATGNGQGNLTNRDIACENYYGDYRFIESFIRQSKEIDLESYFYKLGIPLCTLKDGKMYPLSRQANSVLDIMRIHLENKGCQTVTGAKALAIYNRNGIFTVSTEKGEIHAENVIMATGGKSAKQFGTDGTAYALVEKFGHKLTELYPSLVQLKCDLSSIRGLKGLKENARVTAISNGREVKSAVGEVLFTEYGVSGNAVFQVSGHLTNSVNSTLKIEFLPEITDTDVEKLLTDRENSGLVGENRLLGILNKRIGQAVIKTAKSQSAKDVTKALKEFKLKVTGNLGFNYAQVTKGGIKTQEIDEKTYESKLVKGLYLVGEMLDVDGDCGGYNLTFAFVSGIVCAKDIKEKYKELK
ncbi:MAG: aminoacetone oxidase family FAD-binding enzyme [Clostridia bacterium]|nr:aminoacetone oxidase family FAD-binding enzyme [Clostridia bacterium]